MHNQHLDFMAIKYYIGRQKLLKRVLTRSYLYTTLVALVEMNLTKSNFLFKKVAKEHIYYVYS